MKLAENATFIIGVIIVQTEIVFETLCSEVLEALRDIGLGDYSIRNYYYEGMWPIIKGYRAEGKILYDPVFINEFVEKIHQEYLNGNIPSHIKMHVRKVASLFEEYTQTGSITWQRIKPDPSIQLSPYYKNLLDEFCAYEQRRNAYGAKHLRSIIGICRTFFNYLETRDFQSVTCIELKTVSEYLVYISPDHQSSMDLVQCALRYLCEFLLLKAVCIDFRPVLTAKPSTRRKLRPSFTKSEVHTILDSAQYESTLPLRDTAVFMLASSLGMRAVDVANLKLSDVKWENHEIRFTQSKTGVEIILPLEPAVGNAIANYILHERPATNSDSLFVRSRAPYRAMAPIALGDRLRKHMKLTDVGYVPGTGKGFHSFRRYVASSMIDNDVPVDTVKEVLGHTQINSMKPYIRISKNKLALCALDFKGVDVTQEELL